MIYLRYYMVLWLEVQAIQILTMMLDQITNQMKLQQITMLVSKAFLLSLSKTLELILNKEIIEKKEMVEFFFSFGV